MMDKILPYQHLCSLHPQHRKTQAIVTKYVKPLRKGKPDFRFPCLKLRGQIWIKIGSYLKKYRNRFHA